MNPPTWRSLEELARSPEYARWSQQEFAPGAAELPEGPSRRDFLKLMGASIALAGATACTRQPEEKIVPYVRQPEEALPGVPQFYATAMTLGGYATGLLVESNEGRPTKIEGNPDHPFSLGATNAFHQAAILDLYDPDRSQAVRRAGEVSSWGACLADVIPALAEQAGKGGAGLRVLTETVTSPTLSAQLDALLAKYPQAHVHRCEPVSRANVHEGARLAFGQPLEPDYDLTKARVIVALDSDFLFAHPASLRHSRQLAAARQGKNGTRLYVAEPTPTVTGSIADHRLPAGMRDIAALLVGGNPWMDKALEDLRANPGAGLVIAGDDQPPAVHAAVHALNAGLGNLGRTVVCRAPAERPAEGLAELAVAMGAGAVELLIILGANPVYHAPADVPFARALHQVERVVQLAPYYDETALHCRWHLPQAHFLETWQDARAIDGTVTIGQPLIEPLYGGKSPVELLAALLDDPAAASGYALHRAYWQTQRPGEGFEKFWRRSVHDGIVADSALPVVPVTVTPPSPLAPEQKGAGLEIVFRPDPSVGDGSFANNGWLQELPKPVTKLTWDNAALLSPALAAQLGVRNEDVVELAFAGRAVHAPVWILPGQARESVTLHLGYGRTAVGRVGNGQGVNAQALRPSAGSGGGLQVRKIAGAHWPLATTQRHHNLEGRDLYRHAGEPAEPPPPADQTLYPDNHPNRGYAWGMAIDLASCTGCNACVIACQAENNIPIVGKGQVIREREMHWLRVDSYFQGDLDDPAIGHQPVPCMHCENAPCEIVCPVEATLHSPEGLNEQIYNRCIGTRYCSNNCPYKVRRFNFLQWADNDTLSFKLGRNPDVTVRSRGVMEKCTYCVQRINSAKITSEKEDRTVRDGEVVTACQQVCPTEAIVFGDINDPASRVSRLKRQSRNYGMLAELNTRPRTTYLARTGNPNPSLA